LGIVSHCCVGNRGWRETDLVTSPRDRYLCWLPFPSEVILLAVRWYLVLCALGTKPTCVFTRAELTLAIR
jgi:hypothetical protein